MTRESDRIAKLNEPVYRDIIRRVRIAHRDHAGAFESCPKCDELDTQLCIDAGLEDAPENVIDEEVLP